MPLTHAQDSYPGSRGTIGANTLAKNPIGVLMALSAVSAVALLLLNLQPLFVGSVARKFGLNHVELGYFATLPLIASFVVFASAPLWLNLLPIRKLIYLGRALSILALVAMAIANAILPLTISFACYAVGVSIVQVPALVALGRMPDSESSLGVYVTASLILAGVMAFLVPTLIEPTFGFNGFLCLILATTLGSTALVHQIPKEGIQADAPVTATVSDISGGGNAVTALSASVIFYLGIIGAWAFLERLGVQAGLDIHGLGLSFAGALLIGGTGPFAAAYFGERISTSVATVMTAAMFALFAALLLIGDVNPLKFALALVSFNIAWNFGIPYFLAITGRADASGRALALAPAAMTLGAAGGPALAGNLLSTQGPAGLIAAFGLVLAISFAMFTWVDMRSSASRISL